MEMGTTLEQVLRLEASVHSSAAFADAVTNAILHMADAAVSLSEIISRPPLSGFLGAPVGATNSDGDAQKKLDLVAEDLFSAALRKSPVACYLSEETEGASLFSDTGLLAVAVDPLDGSSNIDVNAPIGSLFSILPMVQGATADPALAFRQPGRAQVAAGFFLYGPQTSLVLSTGHGVNVFVLGREERQFLLVNRHVAIPNGNFEYAINASNYRHWHDSIRNYIDDCVQGVEGSHGQNFNMRWLAALVADSYRILTRGGIYLYPADNRTGYEHGRLRLIYEANPVALLVEQAGGKATDGVLSILDRIPRTLHERVPLVMGSADKVDLVRRHHLEMSPPNRESPLFGRRGLMRG
jgi:fructose-1,6-bisphosphatase I